MNTFITEIRQNKVINKKLINGLPIWQFMFGDHSGLVPLLPIPNRTVKRTSADDSMDSHAKVGHRQTPYAKPLWLPSQPKGFSLGCCLILFVIAACKWNIFATVQWLACIMHTLKIECGFCFKSLYGDFIMLKKLFLAVLASLSFSFALAAVDLNTATVEQLSTLKGIKAK